MQLHFLRGDEQTPRGHAIMLVRPNGPTLATYCIVLPIQFSMSRYIPPIIASQLPAEGLRDMTTSPNVMPVPPMFEEIPDYDALLDLADAREDDVVELDVTDAGNEMRRLELAAEACAEYSRLYARFIGSRTRGARIERSQTAIEPVEPVANDTISALLHKPSAISERDQLSEVVRLVGTLRYALEGNDTHLVDETTRSLRRTAELLEPKYRIDDLINAALLPGERGQQLADLYIKRAYRLLEEDYAAIPPIEEQIRQMS
jgi:hypothetical protein